MLFGTSGGGKTSLLNIIGTIDKPTKGTVVVCGTSKFAFYACNPSGLIFGDSQQFPIVLRMRILLSFVSLNCNSPNAPSFEL
jgi:ABC-type lipoprotein export system ATPase subunit